MGCFRVVGGCWFAGSLRVLLACCVVSFGWFGSFSNVWLISVVGFCLVCVLVVWFACFCYAFGCGVCCVVICGWFIGLDGGFGLGCYFAVALCVGYALCY